MPFFRMQARASDTSLMYYWTASSKDYAGAGYPGTGTPEDVAVTSLQPEGTNMTAVTSFAGRSGIVVPQASDYTAAQVNYDNATSGLTATDVQAAIDEIAPGVTPHAHMRPVDEASIVDDGYMNFDIVTTRGNISVGADAITVNEAGVYQVNHIGTWSTISAADPRAIVFDCMAGGVTVARPGIQRFNSDTATNIPIQFGFSWYLEAGDEIKIRNVTGFTINPTDSASAKPHHRHQDRRINATHETRPHSEGPQTNIEHSSRHHRQGHRDLARG